MKKILFFLLLGHFLNAQNGYIGHSNGQEITIDLLTARYAIPEEGGCIIAKNEGVVHIDSSLESFLSQCERFIAVTSKKDQAFLDLGQEFGINRSFIRKIVPISGGCTILTQTPSLSLDVTQSYEDVSELMINDVVTTIYRDSTISGFIREIPFVEALETEYFRGETVKINDGYYVVKNVPNSNWNGNEPDGTFVIEGVDQNPSGVNLFRYSEELEDQGYWARAGSPDGFSIIPNCEIAPDGTRTADRFVYANSSPLRSHTVNNTISIISGEDYTVSMYIKVPSAASNNDMKVRVELNDFSAGRTTIEPDIVNKGWARYSVTLTANATNASSFVDIDFAESGVDVGDTLILWGLQFEPGSMTDYKRTELTPTEEGTVYLHYVPKHDIISIDELYTTLDDTELIQSALDYANVENISTVLLKKDRTLTDTLTVPINVTLKGMSTSNTVGGTYEKLKTIVYLDLQDSTKTAITFVGEGDDQLTGNSVRDIAFIPISKGNALINTGNVIKGNIENVNMASWTDDERYFNYGIILGAGSLDNVIRDCSFLHLNRSGIFSVSSAIMKIDNCRVTEAVHGVEVTSAALYIDGMWIENIDSSAVVFYGNLCHINRLYTEDVPKDTTVASRTLNIKKCSVFSVMNSDLQGGQLVADSLQTYIYLDSVRIATVMNNQIQASRINLKTTSQTGYVTWINNVESNNSDEKVIEGFTHVYDKDKIIIIGSTGQNSFMASDNWMPHLKTNKLSFDTYTATEASALTPDAPMVIYVSSTNGTFTSVGFWGYVSSTWAKL